MRNCMKHIFLSLCVLVCSLSALAQSYTSIVTPVYAISTSDGTKSVGALQAAMEVEGDGSTIIVGNPFYYALTNSFSGIDTPTIAENVTVMFTDNGIRIVSDTAIGDVQVYDSLGMMVTAAHLTESAADITLPLSSGKVYIVRAGGKSFKGIVR